MINPDNWLLNLADAYYNESEIEENEREQVLEGLKNDEVVYSGDCYTITASNCDILDRLARVQKQLICALASGCDTEALSILNRCFDEEVDSIIKLRLE